MIALQHTYNGQSSDRECGEKQIQKQTKLIAFIMMPIACQFGHQSQTATSWNDTKFTKQSSDWVYSNALSALPIMVTAGCCWFDDGEYGHTFGNSGTLLITSIDCCVISLFAFSYSCVNQSVRLNLKSQNNHDLETTWWIPRLTNTHRI